MLKTDLVLLIGICLLLAGCAGTVTMKMTVRSQVFGEVDGQTVKVFELNNYHGVKVWITNYGAMVTRVETPDRNGRVADIVCGFDKLADYQAGHPYFGATVGRVANRIAGASFSLDGKDYTLAANNGPNHLHGGEQGFDKKVWAYQPLALDEGPGLKLTLTSPDGEEGYPGNLEVTVTYVLTYDNELNIVMTASTDQATPVNLTHHSYWNLAGHAGGDILGHELMINADRYTPTDATLIPTGEIVAVEGTPFDFRTAKTIGQDLAQVPGGYDINFVVNGETDESRLAARVKDPKSGRVMELYTTEPGLQFYSGNFLDGTLTGKNGAIYNKHSGFCLETQHYPDSIHQPAWPTVVLQPGQTYRHEMLHRFFVDDD